MSNMSKKRKRDIDEVARSLVDVYSSLAAEDESTRLDAAKTLLEKFSDPSAVTPDQIFTALKRLIKGLCSSRKAARIGFSIVLTEFLSQVLAFPEEQRGLDAFQVVAVLDRETAPVDSVSKQDERDHYFGRVFGAEALLKSGIFSSSTATAALQNLLNVICGVAIRKPWLRQECGWVLYGGIIDTAAADVHVAETILSSLVSHKLIKTPEGVAIWLAVQSKLPDAKLPKDVWKHDNPLYKKEKSILAKAMRDAAPKSEDEQNSTDIKRTPTWNSQLHFAWTIVLQTLYANTDDEGQPKDSKLVSFEQFWTEVVDESFFASSSSTERKHTGFLICSAAIASAPAPLLRFVLRGNALRSLINHTAKGSLLHRAAQMMTKALNGRANESAIASVAISHALLHNTEGPSSFDYATKTKTLEKIVGNAKADALVGIVDSILSYIKTPGTPEQGQAKSKRQSAADLLVTAFGRSLSADVDSDMADNVQSKVLKALVALSYFTPVTDSKSAKHAPTPALNADTRGVIQARLSKCLDRVIQAKSSTTTSLDTPVKEIKRLEKKSKEWKAAVNMDEGVRNALDTAFAALEALPKSTSSDPYAQALRILFSLSILQVYNGEPEAVQILDDLVEHVNNSNEEESEHRADDIIEILLSFSSQPSKFLRRVILQVFEHFAPSMTVSGLESLIRILEADESAKGQQELFDAQPSDVEDEDEGSDDDEDDEDNDPSSADSDVEMLDSDVEEVSAASDAEDDEEDEDEDDAAENDDDEDEEDDELAAFDAKLAAALGTRKGEDDLEASDSSGSDEDMGDDEMEALDEQLATVFRARKDLTNKKKENKSAKGNIVQFKNRVLDLIEVYLKEQHQNSLSLMLIIPLLSTARRTKTKQISDRSSQLLKEFCQRCSKTKTLPTISNADLVIDILTSIHEEVSQHHSSQSHATACSLASILMVKILVATDPDEGVGMAVDAYAELRKKQLTEKKCRVNPQFFTEWNNWCGAFAQQLRK